MNQNITPEQFRAVVEATLEYIAFNWSLREFNTVFPGHAWDYMWSERGEKSLEGQRNFRNFYSALDGWRRDALIKRIMELRLK